MLVQIFIHLIFVHIIQIPSLRRLYLMNNPLDCTCDLFYLKYGDVYRILSIEENQFDQMLIFTLIDGYQDLNFVDI